MKNDKKPDFSGWASKNDLKCADGRVIKHGAFKDQDQMQVPLVWAHKHDSPENVLGHTVLTVKPEGTWVDGYFNDTSRAKASKMLLAHGDIDSLSIWANDLVEEGENVRHGVIREVSLVLAGANPGAKIQTVHLQHGESIITLDEEAIITTGLHLEHANTEESSKTVEDIINDMSEEEQNAVAAIVAAAVEDAQHSALEDGVVPDAPTDAVEEKAKDQVDGEPVAAEADKQDPEEPPAPAGDHIKHSQEGTSMTNVFEGDATKVKNAPTFSHDDMKKIMTRGAELNSFKAALSEHLEHADGDYGIQDIEQLFPQAKNIRQTPDWIKRKSDWVDGIINGATHTPFSRIRSMSADITHEEARARGYIKGNLKKDEFFAIKSRVTLPKTIYKKQKLDRDDIIDITEFDVVIWLKGEMRMMLEEEIARAVLLGDGRDAELPNGDANPDKINEENIRPIASDHDFYSHKVELILSDDGSDVQEWMEAVLRSRKVYKGTGSPAFYTTEDRLTDALLSKDGMGRRHFKTVEDVAAELRVSRIITVEAMEAHTNILGILVNISDYTIGTDAGGKIASFEDFDIDYNQYKYLIETRLSGALTRHKSAVVFMLATVDAVTPAAPTQAGNVLTIPGTAGVSYFVDGKKVTGSYTMTKDTTVTADAADGRYIPADADEDWSFAFTA